MGSTNTIKNFIVCSKILQLISFVQVCVLLIITPYDFVLGIQVWCNLLLVTTCI